jgi:hypothetical protein
MCMGKSTMLFILITLLHSFCLNIFIEKADAQQVETIDLPQSGQVNSYTPLDDGFIQAGLEWPTQERFSVSNGTVIDNLTNLRWIQHGWCAAGLTGVSYEEIANKIADLNADPAICYLDENDTGWRLPSIVELMSLMHVEPDSGAVSCLDWLTKNYFQGIMTTYWTSTSDVKGENLVWYIKMINGTPDTSDITDITEYHHLLLVKDNVL